MLLTVSYSQTASGINTGRVELRLEGAKFFINQNQYNDFLINENRNLKEIDSLSTMEISGLERIVDSCDNISSFYQEIITEQSESLDLIVMKNTILRNNNKELEESVSKKNKTILWTMAALIFETILIFTGK